jgi:hypothetical protein
VVASQRRGYGLGPEGIEVAEVVEAHFEPCYEERLCMMSKMRQKAFFT